MTQDSEGSGGAAQSSSWPSSGDVADTPASPMAAAGGAAMTLGSVLTIAGILVLFVIFAFGLVSLQYCFNSWDDRERQRLQQQEASGRRGRRRRGGMSMSRRTATRGVDPELLRSLPVTVYRAGAAAPGSEKEAAAVECAVCLAELEDGEAARFLPRCGHGFHAECVDTWLASHTTCPLCRLTVAKPDAPPPALLLPVSPEPANYAAATLPASVLLGVSGHTTAATRGGDTGASPAGARDVMVIEIPELAVPAALTPRGADKSPGSARLRSSFRRLWSFGRQGPGASSSCSCAGAGEGADLEQGVSVTADRPESNTKFLSSLQ
ncbi:unnamed protein product [Urochloa decumbens]|uniref:RING-type E3 ubiquitin transferase n=1 Tax=Urochloa decumbens TaxID=240449 RepID=A0ABC8VB44_9POAL